MKEKLENVKFSEEPKIEIRVISEKDTKPVKKHKKKFPFLLEEEVFIIVDTDERTFKFKIHNGYYWNGADIPRFLWRCIGSSTQNEYLKASMVHDYMLEYKNSIMKETLKNSLSKKEYRRLTSLIFRQILKDTGTWTIKANIMAWAVDVFQATINMGSWK